MPTGRQFVLRVGFDARWYNHSGVGNYVAGLVQALARSPGVQLFIYEDPARALPDLGSSAVVRIPVHSSRYSPLAQLELAWRCRADRLDVFHSPFYPIPFAAPCPVVVTVHDLIPFLFPIGSPVKRWMVQLGYRAAVHRATHIVADSAATAGDLQRLLGVPGGQISVVHLAVPREHFHATPREGEFRRLQQNYGIRSPYVAIPNARNLLTKNLRVALEVASVAEQRTGQFQVVLFGSGPQPEDAAGRAYHGLDCIRTGFIGTQDLGALLRHAAAFILPSLYEGFGLPLLEAMSCGCPAVTTSGGSLAEVAADGAQVFDASDITGMAEALTHLLSDESFRLHWRNRAMERASHFSWERAASETAVIYRRACGWQNMPDASPDGWYEAERTRS